MNQGIAHAVRSTSQIEAFKLVGKRTCSCMVTVTVAVSDVAHWWRIWRIPSTSLQKSGTESHNKAKIIGTLLTEVEVECCCWVNNNYYYYYIITWLNQKCDIRKFPGQCNFLEGQQFIFEYKICSRLKMVWYSFSITGKFYHVIFYKNFHNVIWGCKAVVIVVTKQWSIFQSSFFIVSSHYRRKIHTPFMPFKYAGQLQVL